MIKVPLPICSAILALTCIGASAQSRSTMSGMYIEADYSKVNFKVAADQSIPSPDITVKPSMYKFILGAEVHPNLAIEGMLAGGGSDNATQANVAGTPVSLGVKVNNAFGVFLKPKFNVTDDLELFGRIGYNRVNLSATITTPTLIGTSGRGGDNSVAYGIGAKYNITREWSVVADYTQYFKKQDVTINGVSVGVAYNF